jgi:mRNA-degrading endonuclease RelE of RelBE toxin-antitoxin system
VMMNPKGPPVVAGTGGLRKIRFAKKGHGKSSGYRVGYVYFEEYGTIGLLAVYSKSDQADIPPAQRLAIKKGIEAMHGWIESGG